MRKQVLALALTGAMVAAMGTAVFADEEKTNYTFGFTEWISCEFFDSVYEGLDSVISEHEGDKVIHTEGQADITVQQGVVEDFIAQGVDLVFYNPVDSDASAVAVQEMKDAGIIIVNFDSQVQDLSQVEAFVATNNFAAGAAAAEQLVKDFPDGAKIAVLDYPANTAAVDREEGFLSVVEQNENIEIVATLDSEGLTETATNQMDDILQANPDLDAVFAINDDGGLGAFAAINAAGMDTLIYSVNGSPEAKKLVAEGGIFRCTAAQSTINMGKQSAEVAYKILAGEDYEHEILIDPIAITSENIEEYGVDGWQ